jgi:AcrR family transcriptional regulator
MRTSVKTKPDDTSERIIATAETLFRRLGFGKTTVCDIASELRMSPANIYRFFPSKDAIVQAICKKALLVVDEKAWAIARSKGPAAERLERLIVELTAFHKKNFATEKRVADLVVAGIEQNWDAIRAHREVMCHIVELILRDGIAAGEFESVDPRRIAELFLRSVVAFTNPLVLPQYDEEGRDLLAEARATVRFVLRAITPR